MRLHLPLVYLFGLDEGLYRASWPAYVVGDVPERLRFQIALDDEMYAAGPFSVEPLAEIRRRYVTEERLRRLHQDGFRARVLRAYAVRCSICRLKHRELLDAGHILSDRHPRGDPVVPNGLALCKIHHAAFDQHILGVRPDHVIEVRADILREKDGPMLLHGLQELNGGKLVLPRHEPHRPDRERLAERYELFRKAI
jgi:putative restriction endonuclease